MAGLDRNAAALAAMVEESQSFATTVIGVAADVAVFQEVEDAVGSSVRSWEGWTLLSTWQG